MELRAPDVANNVASDRRSLGGTGVGYHTAADTLAQAADNVRIGGKSVVEAQVGIALFAYPWRAIARHPVL